MKKRTNINEVKQLQRIAGLLKEDELDFSSNPLSGGDTLDTVPLINFLVDAADHIFRVQEDGEIEEYEHEGSLLGWVSDFSEWIDGFYEEEEDLQKFDRIWDAVLSKFETEPEKYTTADDFINYFRKLAGALKNLKNNRIRSIEKTIQLTENLDLDFNPLGPERKRTIEYVIEKYRNQILKLIEDSKENQQNQSYWQDLRSIIEKMLSELKLSTKGLSSMIIVLNDIVAGDYDPDDIIDYIKDYLTLHKKFTSTGFQN